MTLKPSSLRPWHAQHRGADGIDGCVGHEVDLAPDWMCFPPLLSYDAASPKGMTFASWLSGLRAANVVALFECV
jgi:hypothetical protein